MSGEHDGSQIIECELRLHVARPKEQSPGPLTFADWAKTAVGDAVTFQAVASPERGAWNGPLPPGAQVSAAMALENPYWSVFLPASKGVPILFGRVGRALQIGEQFTLQPGTPESWRHDVTFDGAIVIR